jgi:hypothetical protein
MRNGQNKRMRGRNRKSQNPLTRVYESNGPDVKIRGTASHVADKYLQLARDAQASGDPVGAENYYQHAEHYFRMIAAAQEQFRQSNPYYRGDSESREETFEEGEEEAVESPAGEQPFGTREPQPFVPREGQPFREQQQFAGREQHGNGPQPQAGQGPGSGERLPAFITGGGGQQQPSSYQGGGYSQDSYNGQGDRFPLHRRRRRHRGPRSDQPGGRGGPGETPDEGGGGRHRPNE